MTSQSGHSLRLVNLLQAKKSFFILAKTAQAVPTTTDRAHEVHAEAVEIRLGTSRELWELGMAADAGPHATHTTLARRRAREAMSATQPLVIYSHEFCHCSESSQVDSAAEAAALCRVSQD